MVVKDAYKARDSDRSGLTDSVSTVLGLVIDLWVLNRAEKQLPRNGSGEERYPVGIVKDDVIGAGQVDTQATRSSRQQKDAFS